MDKIKIKEAIVVEGRYDRHVLAGLVDGLILETSGFAIFTDREQLELLRQVAETRGLIILTDSDGAGFLIRNYLNGALPRDKVKHAYIPDIYGKERRKDKASSEGKLGVEGMDREILLEALRRAGITEAKTVGRRITVADLYELGLSGQTESAVKRRALQKKLRLPEKLSSKALLQVLSVLYDYDELKIILEGL